MTASELETEPRLHDTWFTHLSEKEQDELRTRWNQRAEEQARRSRSECHRALLDHALTIASFGAVDLLLGWDGTLSLLVALALGAFLGGLILVLDAPRAFACVMGVSALMLHQWLLRGGLGLWELALMLPFGAIFWFIGKRRESIRR